VAIAARGLRRRRRFGKPGGPFSRHRFHNHLPYPAMRRVGFQQRAPGEAQFNGWQRRTDDFKRRNSQVVQKLRKPIKTRSSFLKKRTKKLLLRDAKVVARPLAKNYQSFFASFCSQKEFLSFFIAF
jgi:hypothetical protein